MALRQGGGGPLGLLLGSRVYPNGPPGGDDRIGRGSARDAGLPGAPPAISNEQMEALIVKTLHQQFRNAAARPMLPGVPGRKTRGDVRRGATKLYAVLDSLPRIRCGVASKHMITGLTPRNRACESQRFLDCTDQSLPDELAVHVVLNDGSTDRTATIQR